MVLYTDIPLIKLVPSLLLSSSQIQWSSFIQCRLWSDIRCGLNITLNNKCHSCPNQHKNGQQSHVPRLCVLWNQSIFHLVPVLMNPLNHGGHTGGLFATKTSKHIDWVTSQILGGWLSRVVYPLFSIPNQLSLWSMFQMLQILGRAITPNVSFVQTIQE